MDQKQITIASIELNNLIQRQDELFKESNDLYKYLSHPDGSKDLTAVQRAYAQKQQEFTQLELQIFDLRRKVGEFAESPRRVRVKTQQRESRTRGLEGATPSQPKLIRAATTVDTKIAEKAQKVSDEIFRLERVYEKLISGELESDSSEDGDRGEVLKKLEAKRVEHRELLLQANISESYFPASELEVKASTKSLKQKAPSESSQSSGGTSSSTSQSSQSCTEVSLSSSAASSISESSGSSSVASSPVPEEDELLRAKGSLDADLASGISAPPPETSSLLSIEIGIEKAKEEAKAKSAMLAAQEEKRAVLFKEMVDFGYKLSQEQKTPSQSAWYNSCFGRVVKAAQRGDADLVRVFLGDLDSFSREKLARFDTVDSLTHETARRDISMKAAEWVEGLETTYPKFFTDIAKYEYMLKVYAKKAEAERQEIQRLEAEGKTSGNFEERKAQFLAAEKLKREYEKNYALIYSHSVLEEKSDHVYISGSIDFAGFKAFSSWLNEKEERKELEKVIKTPWLAKEMSLWDPEVVVLNEEQVNLFIQTFGIRMEKVDIKGMLEPLNPEEIDKVAHAERIVPERLATGTVITEDQAIGRYWKYIEEHYQKKLYANRDLLYRFLLKTDFANRAHRDFGKLSSLVQAVQRQEVFMAMKVTGKAAEKEKGVAEEKARADKAKLGRKIAAEKKEFDRSKEQIKEREKKAAQEAEKDKEVTKAKPKEEARENEKVQGEEAKEEKSKGKSPEPKTKAHDDTTPPEGVNTYLQKLKQIARLNYNVFRDPATRNGFMFYALEAYIASQEDTEPKISEIPEVILCEPRVIVHYPQKDPTLELNMRGRRYVDVIKAMLGQKISPFVYNNDTPPQNAIDASGFRKYLARGEKRRLCSDLDWEIIAAFAENISPGFCSDFAKAVGEVLEVYSQGVQSTEGGWFWKKFRDWSITNNIRPIQVLNILEKAYEANQKLGGEEELRAAIFKELCRLGVPKNVGRMGGSSLGDGLWGLMSREFIHLSRSKAEISKEEQKVKENKEEEETKKFREEAEKRVKEAEERIRLEKEARKQAEERERQQAEAREREAEARQREAEGRQRAEQEVAALREELNRLRAERQGMNAERKVEAAKVVTSVGGASMPGPSSTLKPTETTLLVTQSPGNGAPVALQTLPDLPRVSVQVPVLQTPRGVQAVSAQVQAADSARVDQSPTQTTVAADDEYKKSNSMRK